MGLSNMEQQMLDKGYVSCRMVAAKVGKHPTTVRVMTRPPTDLVTVHVDQAVFIEIASLQKHYGKKASDLLGLGSWGDVGGLIDDLQAEGRSGFYYEKRPGPRRSKKVRSEGRAGR